jgi:hypothetical protein
MMTQKDFELIASSIHHLISFWRREGIGNNRIDADVILMFGSKLYERNPLFNRDRFEEAICDGLKRRPQEE